MGNESHMSMLTVLNSGNTYYYRSRIPFDLIEHFGGLKEFRISSSVQSNHDPLELLKFLIRKSQESMRKLDKV